MLLLHAFVIFSAHFRCVELFSLGLLSSTCLLFVVLVMLVHISLV